MKGVAVPREGRIIMFRSHALVHQSVYNRYVVSLIACFSIIRLMLAGSIELGTDESYYWLYTQRLRWNYFDHPAMVAVWGRLFSLNMLLQSELFVRPGSIVGAGFATWFIYKATATFSSAKAGWYAAVLLNTSFYASIVVGLFIMPDSPQLFFWTLSLWMVARIIMEDDKSLSTWLLFGLAMGLCMMSNPVNVALIAFALTIGYQYIGTRHPQLLVLIFIGLPLCLFLLLVSLFRSVFPHWSGPTYITLTPVAAIWLEQFDTQRFFHRWLGYSVSAYVLFILGWQAAINYMPGTIGSKNELTLGKGDVTLDRYGWKDAGKAFSDFMLMKYAMADCPPTHR